MSWLDARGEACRLKLERGEVRARDGSFRAHGESEPMKNDNRVLANDTDI